MKGIAHQIIKRFQNNYARKDQIMQSAALKTKLVNLDH